LPCVPILAGTNHVEKNESSMVGGEAIKGAKERVSHRRSQKRARKRKKRDNYEKGEAHGGSHNQKKCSGKPASLKTNGGSHVPQKKKHRRPRRKAFKR